MFIVEHGKLGAAVLVNFNGDIDEASSTLLECYHGEFTSVADYVQEITEEITDIPDNLKYYIDYEKMASDMEMSGDIFIIELDFQEVHVFYNQ